LLKYPKRNVALVSYSSTLAENKSVQAQALAVKAVGELHPDVQSRSDWSLRQALDVSFRARGLGGAITGNPVDLMILDDLIKSHEEAESAVFREKVWDYLDSTIATRFTKNAACIAILTRWHLDDYGSRLNKRWGWPIYNVPAICEKEETDPLGRKLGEVAAPLLKPKAMIEERKKNMSAYSFSALYQGNPTSQESTRIKREWFKYYPADKIDEIAKRYNVYQTVDTSGTANETSDYFVVLTFAFVTKTLDGEIIVESQDANRARAQGRELIRCIYVLDVFRQKFETTEHDSALQHCRERWRPIVQYVENKTFGLNIIQSAKKKSLPIEPIEADVSKFLRSERISVYYKNGRVFHPSEAPWLKDFEEEISTFPVAAYDDQFDCVSYAGIVADQKKI
jgi:predicted phage terminase large subunit-like protein